MIIVVGPDCEEFMVHANRLAKTKFFEIHGTPKARPHIKVTPSTATIDLPAWGSDELKNENKANEGEAMDIDARLPKMVDYHLDPKDSQAPRAFGIFVNALYNDEPAEIKDRESLKISLKTYRYAINYHCFSLQNRIVERFREHYLSHKIKWDEIMWVLKMFGDDANATPLTRYLFEQVAHDIATRGFNAFNNENQYLKDYYIKQATREARCALFEILVRHAHTARHPDPAEGRNDWRVIESGSTAGAWVPEPFDTL